MRLSFWGVRGSAPSPHPDTRRYGGHTPALELRAGNQIVLLDAGTGLRPLGEKLQGEPLIPGLTAHLFFTHYHWAHVQGLPYFAPLTVAANRFTCHGPAPQTPGGLRGVIETLLGAPFASPGQGARANFTFEEVTPTGEILLGDLRVRVCRSNHPGGALAYRFDHEGCSIVYAPDHEPGNAELDLGLRQLARGAQLLVCDAQLLPSEQTPGSGHATWESAVQLAREAGVRNLVLFHHAPDRADHVLDQMNLNARRTFPRTWAAREGMHFDLDPDSFHLWETYGREALRVPTPLPVLVESHLSAAPQRHEAHLHNLSFHGAYFVSPLQYDLDDQLDLLLDLGGGGQDYGDPTASALRLQGQVMRVEPLTTNGGWVGVGVRFTEPRRTDAVPLPRNPKPTDA